MNFTFHTPTKIIFGLNKFQEIGKIVNHLGKNCLLVTGKTSMKKYGYLDKTNEEKAQMTQMEDKYLSKLNGMKLD